MKDVNLEFGINAGKVWNALDSRGSLTKNQIMKLTNLNKNQFLGAVGWLAKENKIRKDGEFFTLDETNLNIRINEDASIIWDVLDTKKGDINNLSKITQLNEEDVQIALGWLAKDGKLDNIDNENNIDTISSGKNQVNDLKDEINALKMDLASRNVIIKEITEQLNNNQTKFIENSDVVGKQKLKIDNLENNLISKTDEVNSAQLEILNLKDEISGLIEDLDSRNKIINNITEQLMEKQTRFIESSGIIENLRRENNQNKDKIRLMSDKFNDRIINVTDLQMELDNKRTNLEPTESRLFNNDQPLIQTNKEPVEWDEFDPLFDDSLEMKKKSDDNTENTLKNKKLELDES